MPNTSKYRLVHQVSYLYHVVSNFPLHPLDLLNLYQIWNLQSWHCLKSFSVPAYIIQRGNQYFPSINFDEKHQLSAVSYINSNEECLVLNYDRSLYCLLMLKNYELKLWNDENVFKNKLHSFPSFLGRINTSSISSNQQLITCSSGYVS